MFGLSAGEILLIALIALLLFGNEKLPQNIKKFLKGWNQTKKVAFDLQKSWHDIKLDLKNNIELYDDKSVVIKPANHIVSQEEIDSYTEEQKTLETGEAKREVVSEAEVIKQE